MSTGASTDMDADALDTRIRALEQAFSREHRRELRALPNVRGTGVGLREVGGARLQEAAITVFVREKVPLSDLEPDEQVPDYVVVDGEYVPTDVRLAGDFRADVGSETRRERVRPIIGGLAVRARQSAAIGTISGLFRTRSGQPRMLMSRHVISEAETGPIGRLVLQPKGGQRFGSLAETHDFYTDAGTRVNTLDTALIKPDDIDTMSGVYLGWLSASETGRASIGDRVVVFSSTRGIAAGEVITRGVFASLSLPSGDSAEYGGLIEYDVPSEPGSSGAMVGMLDPKTRKLTIVGQHVGGTGGSSLMIPWVRIEREFGELTPEDPFKHTTSRASAERDPAMVTLFTEDDGGAFVGNATVTIDGKTYQTDEVGEKTIELTPGTYDITAEKSGYASTSRRITVDWNQTVQVALVLAWQNEPAKVTFRVRDSDGVAVSGANVTIEGNGETITGTTNSSGNYTRNLAEGSYQVTVVAGGFHTNPRIVDVEWSERLYSRFDMVRLDEQTLVDDFNRVDIDPWVNTHPEYDVDPANHAVKIIDALWAENGRALQIVPASSAVVTSGLPNLPAAGLGPNSDGAWEAQIRMDEYGGSANIVRLDWALNGDEFLRWQIQDDGISIREGTNWQYGFSINQAVGDVRILRVNEWRTNGYIDTSIHDENGAELDRISTTLDGGSAAPDSGGMRVWTNYSTGFSVGHIRLLE